MDICTVIIEEIIRRKIKTLDKALKVRQEICKKYKSKEFPSIRKILLSAKPSQLARLRFLQTKPVRTISGVAPVAVMTKPFPCPHGKCTICPGGPESVFGNTPQSYTGYEPATRRGIRNFFDPYLQVFNRLEHYVLLNHSIDKAELIIMGGTFPSTHAKYQNRFVEQCLKAMNDFGALFFRNNQLNIKKFKEFFMLPHDLGDENTIRQIQRKILKLKLKNRMSLKNEQKRNENAKVKCVALCIETRPDYGKLKEGNQMLKLGCTRVELGIQSVYDDVLKNIERGHSVKESIESIRILKNLGFKISAHYMIGLPGSSKKKDIEGFKQLFENPDFRPDMLKIYPCVVVKGTKLYKMWKNGRYKPLSAKEAAETIAEMKKYVPEYCRIQRIQRDIAENFIEAGPKMSNLRQYIHENFDVKCRCIRCREPKGLAISIKGIKINIHEYEASEGKEFFVSAESPNDKLVGFCRMRFPSQFLRKEITSGTAIIRELHVYGKSTALGETGKVQHRGLGKKLLKKCEEIAKKHNKDKIAIISGIGVRSYYRKLGYKKQGPYMVKAL